MKKLLFILSIVSLIFMSTSCEEEPETCNCGIVQDDALETDANGTLHYTLTVKSECSGVNKKVYVNESDWLSNHVGDYMCITGAGTWLVAPDSPIVETIHPIDKQF